MCNLFLESRFTQALSAPINILKRRDPLNTRIIQSDTYSEIQPDLHPTTSAFKQSLDSISLIMHIRTILALALASFTMAAPTKKYYGVGLEFNVSPSGEPAVLEPAPIEM